MKCLIYFALLTSTIEVESRRVTVHDVVPQDVPAVETIRESAAARTLKKHYAPSLEKHWKTDRLSIIAMELRNVKEMRNRAYQIQNRQRSGGYEISYHNLYLGGLQAVKLKPTIPDFFKIALDVDWLEEQAYARSDPTEAHQVKVAKGFTRTGTVPRRDIILSMEVRTEQQEEPILLFKKADKPWRRYIQTIEDKAEVWNELNQKDFAETIKYILDQPLSQVLRYKQYPRTIDIFEHIQGGNTLFEHASHFIASKIFQDQHHLGSRANFQKLHTSGATEIKKVLPKGPEYVDMLQEYIPEFLSALEKKPDRKLIEFLEKEKVDFHGMTEKATRSEYRKLYEDSDAAVKISRDNVLEIGGSAQGDVPMDWRKAISYPHSDASWDDENLAEWITDLTNAEYHRYKGFGKYESVRFPKTAFEIRGPITQPPEGYHVTNPRNQLQSQPGGHGGTYRSRMASDQPGPSHEWNPNLMASGTSDPVPRTLEQRHPFAAMGENRVIKKLRLPVIPEAELRMAGHSVPQIGPRRVTASHLPQSQAFPYSQPLTHRGKSLPRPSSFSNPLFGYEGIQTLPANLAFPYAPATQAQANAQLQMTTTSRTNIRSPLDLLPHLYPQSARSQLNPHSLQQHQYSGARQMAHPYTVRMSPIAPPSTNTIPINEQVSALERTVGQHAIDQRLAASTVQISQAYSTPPTCTSHSTGPRQTRTVSCDLTAEEENGAWLTEKEKLNDEGFEMTLESQVTGKKIFVTQKVAERMGPLRSALRNEASWASRANKGLGRVGALFGVYGAITAYQNGNYGQAASIGAQTGFQFGTDLAHNVPPLRKTIVKANAKLMTRVASGIGKIANFAPKTVAQLGSKLISATALAGPVGSAMIGGWMCYEDFQLIKSYQGDNSFELFALYVNLVLDVTITILSVVGFMFPEVEVIVLALTVIRMAWEAVANVVEGALQEVKSFIADATIEAMEDCKPGRFHAAFCLVGVFGKRISDVALGSVFPSIRKLATSEKEWRQKVRDLRAMNSYMRLEGECEGTAPVRINFLNQELSSFGGGVKFTLFDDQSFEITMENVPIYGKGTETKTQRYEPCRMLRDVILGIGVSQRPKLKYKRGWLLIVPWRQYFVADGMEEIQSSLHGTYRGNNKDNVFYAMQGKLAESGTYGRCQALDSKNLTTQIATRYSYMLYGSGGNDAFILGPESAYVEGGDGRDVYSISSTGGRTVINNFARDKDEDILSLEVSYESIQCSNREGHLVINYCGIHEVIVLSWFVKSSSPEYQHLKIRTGMVGPERTLIYENVVPVIEDGTVTCHVIEVDASPSDRALTLDLAADTKYKHTRQVITPRHSFAEADIHGNDLDNTILCDGSNYRINGGKGKDTYIFTDSCRATITDFGPEKNMVVLPINYANLSTSCMFTESATTPSLGIHHLLNEDYGNIVTLVDFDGEAFSFVSSDGVVFEIRLSVDVECTKFPFMLDLSAFSNVDVNLRTNQMNGEHQPDLSEVMTIYGSKHSDRIVGNRKINTITCSGPETYMEGGGEVDVYYISETCGAEINVHSLDQTTDVIKLFCKNEDLIVCPETGLELIISCQKRCPKNKQVRVVQWLESIEFQNFKIETSDGVTHSFGEYPRRITLEKFGITSLYVTEKHQPFGTNIDLETNGLSHVSLVRVGAENSDVKIFGNAEGNVLIPGKKQGDYRSYLEGRDGSDQYRVNQGDNRVTINNFAPDQKIDLLFLGLPYDAIRVAVNEIRGDVLIFDKANKNGTFVIVQKYWINESYQHLMIKTADDVQFKLTKLYPFKQAQVIDCSHSSVSQYIQIDTQDHLGYSLLKSIIGASYHSNQIFGTTSTKHISGGNKRDILYGGLQSEILEGMDGDDTIWGRQGDDVLLGGLGDDLLAGGSGDDVIYGGGGRDRIFGGPGFDFLVFEGGYHNETFLGVHIDLMSNFVGGVAEDGSSGPVDADGDYYEGIEGIMGTALDDILADDHGNNEIRAGSGRDRIISYGGTDYLVGESGADIYDLTEAEGHKTIDNFDNTSTTQNDRLNISTKLTAVNCKFAFGDSLFLRFERRLDKGRADLTILLHNWFLGEEYRHLEMFWEEAEDATENRPDSNIDARVDPRLSINELSLDKVVIRLECRFCPTWIQIQLRTVENSSASKTEFITENVTVYQTHLIPNQTVELSTLKRGRTYFVVPIVWGCGVEVARGSQLVVHTIPSAPKSLMAFSTVHGLQLTWKIPQEEDKNWESYRYTVEAQTTNGEVGNPDAMASLGISRTLYWAHNEFQAGVKELDFAVNPDSIIEFRVSTNFYYVSSSASVATLRMRDVMTCDEIHKSGIKLVPSLEVKCREFHKPCKSCLKNGEPREPCSPNNVTDIECAGIRVCPSPLALQPLIHPLDHISGIRLTPRTTFPPGKTIGVVCDPMGKSPRAGIGRQSVKTTCVQGKWNPPLPNCLEGCVPPTRPANGNIDLNRGMAFYYCEPTAFLAGPWRLHCINNSWEPMKESVCIPIHEKKKSDPISSEAMDKTSKGKTDRQ